MDFIKFYNSKHNEDTTYFELFVPFVINSFFRDGLILDLGSGKQVRNISSKFKRVIFSDISINAMNYAKNLRKSADFLVLDACKLPFKKESFDSVLCKDILEHVKSDYACVDELNRIIKKGGFVGVWVPKTFVKNDVINWRHLRCYSKETLNFLFNNFEPVLLLNNRSWNHFKLGIILNFFVGIISFLPWNFLPSFKRFRNEFAISKSEYVLYLFDRYIDMLLLKLFPFLGTTLIAVFKKV